MTRTISGLFQNRERALAAMRELAAAGVPAERVALISSGDADRPIDPPSPTEAEIRPEVGAGVGAGAGLLAGLATFAIPGVGPLIGAGWLAVALGGAVTGGFAGGVIGALISSGLTEEEAHAHADALMGGGHIVSVRAQAHEEEYVQTIFTRLDAGDLEARTLPYRTEGSETE
jgi:hypothetical protein